ncbi:hypothetical protein AAG570_003017 [Ranatra chinensis]|uniref:Uncharacterized protein n=1 Tax=Ranatra chinensis TaxID=642074 RepID=A0ABD0Y5J4_9HEMI
MSERMDSWNPFDSWKRITCIMMIRAGYQNKDIMTQCSLNTVKTIRHELETCNGDYGDVARRKIPSRRSDCVRTAEFLTNLQEQYFAIKWSRYIVSRGQMHKKTYKSSDLMGRKDFSEVSIKNLKTSHHATISSSRGKWFRARRTTRVQLSVLLDHLGYRQSSKGCIRSAVNCTPTQGFNLIVMALQVAPRKYNLTPDVCFCGIFSVNARQNVPMYMADRFTRFSRRRLWKSAKADARSQRALRRSNYPRDPARISAGFVERPPKRCGNVL